MDYKSQKDLQTKKYQELLKEKFLPLLEEDYLDKWKKGWYVDNSETPQNAFSGRPYSATDALFLSLYMQEKNIKDPRFATFQQIQSNELRLKKGAKSCWTIGVFAYPYWDEENPRDNGKPYYTSFSHRKELIESDPDRYIDAMTPTPEHIDKHYPRRDYYKLFSAADIENIRPYEKKKVKENTSISLNEFVKNAADAMKVKIKEDGGNDSFYRLQDDSVHVPEKSHFKSQEDFDVVCLHELTHATGIPERLNRECYIKYHSDIRERAKEELVAELGAVLLRSDAKVKTESIIDLENHKKYLQHWKDWLLEDKEKTAEKIDKSFQLAQKASSYIIRHERTKEKEQLEELKLSKIDFDKCINKENLKKALEDPEVVSILNKFKDRGGR